MGVHAVKVPDVGEGVAEVELVSWAVTVGQRVARNEVLAEVMTDKANVEIPSPVEGVIAALNGEVGSTMAVGSLLIELDVEGPGTPVDDVPAVATPASLSAADPTASPEPAPAGSTAQSGAVATAPSEVVPAPVVAAERRTSPGPVGGARPPRPEGEKPRATPAVRHRAREAGVDLRQVAGTGPVGRITHDDLDLFLNGGAVAPATSFGRHPDQRVDEQPIVGVRRKIAEHLVSSTTTIPHITYVEEVDVTAVEELRKTLNDQRSDTQPRLTLLPFLVRALVRVLPEFPSMNAHVDDDRGVLTTFGGVHVGIATQTPDGLIVPVLRHAEALSIWEIAAKLSSQAEAARARRSAPSDLQGSTITITSLGALGGLVTTPVINKPEVAIVGVNKIATRPVWAESAFVPRKMMNLSSSFDHRVVDGWDAAQFVQALRRSLEQPALLFIDET